MHELVIKYKNKKTLDALMDFAKYFEFSVVVPPKTIKTKKTEINGVTIIPANSSIELSALENVFSNKNLDAKELRTKAWQRNK